MLKSDIGDVVYSAASHWKDTKQQCPDCLGQKVWHIKTPAGEEFDLECRTCWQGYNGNSGTISSWDFEPVVNCYTIGSVRMDTNDEEVFTYMCEETGIGSGRIHSQKNLFATRENAEIRAEEMVEEAKAAKKAEFMTLQKRLSTRGY